MSDGSIGGNAAPRSSIIEVLQVLLRPSLLLVVSASFVSALPLAATAAPAKPSLSSWTKAKHGKVLTPAKVPPPAPAAPPPAPARASAKSKSDGPPVSGRVAVFGFTGEGAGRVQKAVVSTLRTRGLQVTTALRPVDSAEQYREMAATLRLAAYIDGSVGGDGPQSHATVLVRSGTTGRRIASVRFAGERNGLAADVGNGLWPRTGHQLTRLCAEAAKPRKGGRKALRINAGTPIETTARDDSDVPAHLRNDPKSKADPWADDS